MPKPEAWADSWDGTTPLTTTQRADEQEIIRKIRQLRVENGRVPVWVGNNTHGWKPARSQHFQAGATQICRDHALTNMALWHWFCDRASEEETPA